MFVGAFVCVCGEQETALGVVSQFAPFIILFFEKGSLAGLELTAGQAGC